jgi:hypothetical protein
VVVRRILLIFFPSPCKIMTEMVFVTIWIETMDCKTCVINECQNTTQTEHLFTQEWTCYSCWKELGLGACGQSCQEQFNLSNKSKFCKDCTKQDKQIVQTFATVGTT